MVNPSSHDDLSGGTSESTLVANKVLGEAATRKHFRMAVSAVTVVVIAGLGSLLYMTVCAMLQDLAFVSVPAVSFATALIVAVSGLTIALLHAVFADTSPPKDSDRSGTPGVTSAGIEVVKAAHGMLETIVKGPKG